MLRDYSSLLSHGILALRSASPDHRSGAGRLMTAKDPRAKIPETSPWVRNSMSKTKEGGSVGDVDIYNLMVVHYI